jgi:hypothetical protein
MGCGACCIAPSISSLNKPASVPCPHLTADMRCSLWGRPERPSVCTSLRPEPAMCGSNRLEALARLADLEVATAPGR